MGCSPEGEWVNPSQQREPGDVYCTPGLSYQDGDAVLQEETREFGVGPNTAAEWPRPDDFGSQQPFLYEEYRIPVQYNRQEGLLHELLNPDDVYLETSKPDDFLEEIGKMYTCEEQTGYQQPTETTYQAGFEERIESLFAFSLDGSVDDGLYTVPNDEQHQERQELGGTYQITDKHERTAKINRDVFDSNRRFADWEEFVQYCFPGVYFPYNQFLAAITEDAVVVTLLEPEFCSGICQLAEEKCFADLDAFEAPVFGLVIKSTRFSYLFVKSQSLQIVYLVDAALEVLALAECTKLQNVYLLNNSSRCLNVYSLLLVEENFVNYCGCYFRIVEQALGFLSEIPSDAFLKVAGTRDYTPLRFPISATRNAFRAAKDSYLPADRLVEIKTEKVEELTIESNFVQTVKIMPRTHIVKLKLSITYLRELSVESTDLRYLDLTEMQWIFRLNIANNPNLLLNRHYLPCTLEYLHASNANLVAVNFFALSHLRKCDISRNKLECTTLYGYTLLEFVADNCEFTSAFLVELTGATLMYSLSLNGAVNCGLTCQASSKLKLLDLLHARVVRHLNLEYFPLLETIKLECGETAMVEGRPPATLIEVQLMGCVVSYESQHLAQCYFLRHLDLYNCKLGAMELPEGLISLNVYASDVGKLDLRYCGRLADLNISLAYNLALVDYFLPETLETLSAVRAMLEIDSCRLYHLKTLQMSCESVTFKGQAVPRTVSSVGTLARYCGVLQVTQNDVGRCLYMLLDWRCDEKKMYRIEELQRKTQNLNAKLAVVQANPEKINIPMPRKKPRKLAQRSSALSGPNATAQLKNAKRKLLDVEALAELPEGILDFAAARYEEGEELLDVTESDL